MNLCHKFKIKISLAMRLMLLALFVALSALPEKSFSQLYPRQYLDQALENNPGLRARFLEYESDKWQGDIAAGLPSPELTAGIYTPPMERLMGNQLFDVGLMQMFPWFGTLGRQRRVAEIMADASLEQYRNQRNMLFLDITNQWLEIYETRQQMQIIERFIQILEAREELIYSRYEGGVQRGNLALDIYRLQMQINELDNRFSRLQDELRAQSREFNILLNRSPDLPVEVPDTLLVVEKENIDAMPNELDFDSNPLILGVEAQARAAEVEQELSVLMTRPMFGLGVQYSHFAPGQPAMGQMDGGAMVMPMISVSIPIYGRQNRAIRNQGVIRSQRALLEQEDQFNNLTSQWARIAEDLNKLSTDEEFLTRQLEISQMTWDLILTSYYGGQDGFEELLRIQDQLLELEWRLLETIVRQHQAAARLDMLLGDGVFN